MKTYLFNAGDRVRRLSDGCEGIVSEVNIFNLKPAHVYSVRFTPLTQGEFFYREDELELAARPRPDDRVPRIPVGSLVRIRGIAHEGGHLYCEGLVQSQHQWPAIYRIYTSCGRVLYPDGHDGLELIPGAGYDGTDLLRRR